MGLLLIHAWRHTHPNKQMFNTKFCFAPNDRYGQTRWCDDDGGRFWWTLKLMLNKTEIYQVETHSLLLHGKMLMEAKNIENHSSNWIRINSRVCLPCCGPILCEHWWSLVTNTTDDSSRFVEWCDIAYRKYLNFFLIDWTWKCYEQMVRTNSFYSIVQAQSIRFYLKNKCMKRMGRCRALRMIQFEAGKVKIIKDIFFCWSRDSFLMWWIITVGWIFILLC